MRTHRQYVLITIIIICNILTASSSDGHNPYTIQCAKLNQAPINMKQNLQFLWNILVLHKIDMVCFLVLCPLILLAQIFVIATYIKNTQLLARPGNIFFGIVCIETGLNIHLFVNAIYRAIFNYNQLMPSSFLGFCISTALFGSFFTILHFMYLVMFMIYTIFVFRFSLKKKSQTFWYLLNLFVVMSSIILTLYFYFENFMGLNFYGICSLTSLRQQTWNTILPTIQIILSFIFLFLGVFTYCYFIRHMPQGQNFRKKKLQDSKIIFMYVTGFSSLLILMSSVSLLLQLNCIQQTPFQYINTLILVVNFLRLIQFVFLIFLILFNERFRRKFKHTLKSIFQTFKKKRTLRQNSDLTQIIQIQDVFFDEKLLQMKDKSNQIDLLLLSQVYTIISGVYVAYYEYFRKNCDREHIRKINYRQNITFLIDNKSIIQYQTQARLLIKLKILSCEIIIHNPGVFQKLLSLQGLFDVYQSFRIVDNSRKMSNLAEGQGGRSGQFFFFSADNKYVIKTITCQQYQFYNSNLQRFYEYYQQNPKSLLAKILGLFTFGGDEMQKTYYLVLMKNILGCQKNQVLRVYDLKGSKYDRQVLFQETQINQISKLTLKDIDFINYQTKLHINEQILQTLKQTLRMDSKFLKSLNLLDYSLLVVRVRWDRQPQYPQFWSQLQRVPHKKKDNQYYHIGVIDYMQKWDLQKKGERWWKSFLGKKDVSAQQPSQYQQRFMQFVQEITTNFLSRTQNNESELIELKDVRAATQPNKQKNTQQNMKIKKQRITNKI